MKSDVSADVGPLFAAVDPTDRYHRRAMEEFAPLAAERCPVAISSSTLVEGRGLILRQIGVEAATRWLAEIVADAVLLNPEADDDLAAAAMSGRFPDSGSRSRMPSSPGSAAGSACRYGPMITTST